MSVLTDWVGSAVSALVSLGRHEEARALARRELADASAYDAPRRHGLALSTCGSLDPDVRGLRQMREAVEILEQCNARLELARALVNLGTGLRACAERVAARAPLVQALDIAHGCGAVSLAERARAELIACGARPRRTARSGPDALTPAELRTARMAAEGMSNREIAQAPFVTTKTVEAQLSQAYGKLSIRHRGELSAALSDTARPGRAAVARASTVRARG